MRSSGTWLERTTEGKLKGYGRQNQYINETERPNMK